MQASPRWRSSPIIGGVGRQMRCSTRALGVTAPWFDCAPWRRQLLRSGPRWPIHRRLAADVGALAPPAARARTIIALPQPEALVAGFAFEVAVVAVGEASV